MNEQTQQDIGLFLAHEQIINFIREEGVCMTDNTFSKIYISQQCRYVK